MKRERGVVIVEFAIILPVLIAILLAVITGGIAVSHNVEIQNAARATAIAAAMGTDYNAAATESYPHGGLTVDVTEIATDSGTVYRAALSAPFEVWWLLGQSVGTLTSVAIEIAPPEEPE